MRLFFFALLMAAASLFAAHAAPRGGFAIVIDQRSYDEARAEVEAYAAAVEEVNNLAVTTVVDRWGVPDSIRATLQSMRSRGRHRLVGAVFVGDIPVPMIRDAQHLTSAFKMNQKVFDRRESSVPSDRFYDDFGLKFNYIDKDTAFNYHYYSLSADSRQSVCPDIFSGRIRPSDVGGSSRYDKLRAFLRKCVEAKRARRPLGQVLYFAAHGYISESQSARIDEKVAYFEHFPWLRDGRDRVKFIHHDGPNPIKPKLMSELMRPDLDIAMLHHHGDPDTEYYNSVPLPDTPASAVAFVRKSVRARLARAARRGLDVDSVRNALAAHLDIPPHWADGFDVDSVMAADSIADAMRDLHIADFDRYGFRPNVPVVIQDACFNGSFHLDDCIANRYIFQPGGTVAVVANTVNALQDKWADRLLGLVADGGVVGHLAQFSTYLETHVVGDPTYCFAPRPDSPPLCDLLAGGAPSAWRKMLRGGRPDLQCLAIDRLHWAGAMGGDELARLYLASPHYVVRMMALETLARLADDNFVRVAQVATTDAFELVRRTAVSLIGESGDDRLLPALMSVAITNANSARVNFDAGIALSKFSRDKVVAEFERQFDKPTVVFCDKEKVRGEIMRGIDYQVGRWEPDIRAIAADSISDRKRMMLIRQTRNFMIHDLIPLLVDCFPRVGGEEMQVALLEALGWRDISARRGEIAALCRRVMADDEYAAAVRAEARKTLHRLHGAL